MNSREVVRTIAFVLLTCVAINACFYFVQINEHHRALQTASAGDADMDRRIKSASTTPNTTAEEAALVEVTRSLLMLSDAPEARAWRAHEEAYRARLLAVTLDGAALHHQFGMVRPSTRRTLLIHAPTAAQQQGRKLLSDRALPIDPEVPQHPHDCHGDPGCRLLHSTAMPQLELALEAAQQTLCGTDAGRRMGRHYLACVKGAEDTMPAGRGRAPRWRTASAEQTVHPPTTPNTTASKTDRTTTGTAVCAHAPPARDVVRAWQQEQREMVKLSELVAAARAPPVSIPRMQAVLRSGRGGSRALLHDGGFDDETL